MPAEEVIGIKALNEFWKRLPSLNFLPAIYTVYSCLRYCLKGVVITTSIKTITRTRVNCEISVGYNFQSWLPQNFP